LLALIPPFYSLSLSLSRLSRLSLVSLVFQSSSTSIFLSIFFYFLCVCVNMCLYCDACFALEKERVQPFVWLELSELISFNIWRKQ